MVTPAASMRAVTSLPRRIAKRTVRVVSSTMIRRVGVDATDNLTSRAALIVAPHPDDETLGCGATIARMRSRGVPVHVVLVTGGESTAPLGTSKAAMVQVRRSEAVRAMAVLGVHEDDIQFLSFQDGGLAGSCDAIADALSEAIGSTSAQQVMVTSAGDRHSDHAAVARAARVAVVGGFPSVRLHEYPIWQRVPALTLAHYPPRTGQRLLTSKPGLVLKRPSLVSTQGFLDLKQRAIEVYASQIPHFPLGFVDDFLLQYELFTEVASSR